MAGNLPANGPDRGEQGSVSSGRERPTPGVQFREWLAIGTQSIGGGPGTLYLMRRLLVLRTGWISAAEFLDDWALARATPGITLVAITALLGRRLGGRVGVVVALAGLLGPSTAITLALTAGFDILEHIEAVNRIIIGMEPVALGLSMGFVAKLAKGALRSGKVGWIDLLVVAGAAAAGFVAPDQPFLVIVAGALLGIAWLGKPRPDPVAAPAPTAES